MLSLLFSLANPAYTGMGPVRVPALSIGAISTIFHNDKLQREAFAIMFLMLLEALTLYA